MPVYMVKAGKGVLKTRENPAVLIKDRQTNGKTDYHEF
jgi:hypothetical protein